MVDIQRRLEHMNEVSIDIQVLFPTLFLRPVTTEYDCELALVKSYNRWLADAWKRSNNRLRWVALPPVYSMPDPGKIRAELEFAKANGACGVFMRGFECERLASDRYLFPLYQIAQDLDLAICFHAGNNSFANHDSYTRELGIMIFRFPVMGVFLQLLSDEIPKMFPKLRWAFIEATAQWVPFMVREAQLRLRSKGVRASNTIMTDNNFYVTTQKSDDLPWLLNELGDDNWLIGTDYGHKDVAVEIEAMKRLAEDGSIPAVSAKKILSANPGKLYGLT
jgi:predicted TIM-barrel fold metal-dependent hydrolase